MSQSVILKNNTDLSLYLFTTILSQKVPDHVLVFVSRARSWW